MSQHVTLIEDERIEPYFIKLVNSSYEVHQRHTPKDGKPYTKFISSRSTIREAVTCVVKRKISIKRRDKKSINLAQYLEEIKTFTEMIEPLLGDDSIERQLKVLKRKVEALEKKVIELTPKNKEAEKPLFTFSKLTDDGKESLYL